MFYEANFFIGLNKKLKLFDDVIII